MIIVASGELEIVIEIDGADIVVARLGPGDALNHRNVLLSEMQSMVMVRCTKSAKLLTLKNSDIEYFCSISKSFSRKIDNIETQLFVSDKAFFIDYMPQTKQAQRRVRLQNITANLINAQRIKVEMPSLKSILAYFQEMKYNKKVINCKLLNLFRKRPEDIQDQ